MIYRWDFSADRNGDGIFNITDVWLWAQWLFFLPGDGVIYLFMRFVPSAAQFFELSNLSYSDLGSGVISGIFWFIVGINVYSDHAVKR